MPKASLYKSYIERLELAGDEKQFLQASWYVYAILEDRLISMLESSGGVPLDKKGNPIKMLGTKLGELKRRAKSDAPLRANLDDRAISSWAKKRNTLMHRMADGSLTLSQVDVMAEEVAKDGAQIARDVCAAAMRLKKRRLKEKHKGAEAS